jgi:hypothetical protein
MWIWDIREGLEWNPSPVPIAFTCLQSTIKPGLSPACLFYYSCFTEYFLALPVEVMFTMTLPDRGLPEVLAAAE